MTKKDYIVLARVIRKNRLPNNTLDELGFIDGLCCLLGEDNPRFDRAKFTQACLCANSDSRI